jgi:cobalt transporter subunit CbtB
MSSASIDSSIAVTSNLADNAHAQTAGNSTLSTHRWPAVLALALGAVVIFGVGFGSGIAHNAAHDTRHAMTFPCH